MLEDAKRATELDPSYFKAHLRLGEAQVELGKLPKCQSLTLIDDGIKSLQNALYKCWKVENADTEQKRQFEKQIGRQILRAKKIRWYKQQELKRTEREVIVAQLEELLQEEGRKSSVMSTQSDETPDIGHHLVGKVKAQFRQEEKSRKLRNLDVPDYLLCRITDELMEEPVVLDSGFTYERSQILRHFRANGAFDPLTRQEVDPAVLIENRAVKQATQDYLQRNPWAFEFVPG